MFTFMLSKDADVKFDGVPLFKQDYYDYQCKQNIFPNENELDINKAISINCYSHEEAEKNYSECEGAF